MKNKPRVRIVTVKELIDRGLLSGYKIPHFKPYWIQQIGQALRKTRFCCKESYYNLTVGPKLTYVEKWVYYYNDGDIETVTKRTKL